MSLPNSALPDISPLDDPERRIAPRAKTLKSAKVYFNNMNSTFDCIVRNISATGALLTLDEAAHLPREFGVRIGEAKQLRQARLVYRRGMLAGIHFLDVPEAEEDAATSAAEEIAAAAPTSRNGEIRRLAADALPAALQRNFRWF